VLNIISSMVAMGLLTASGASYLSSLEYEATVASQKYVDEANKRFKDYEQLMPGVVKWPEQP
jgi:hypothetical protein